MFVRARQAYGTRARFLSARWVRSLSGASQTTGARLLLADRVASGREIIINGGMPKDPPHAAIAMGRLGCRVPRLGVVLHCQKWPFCEFRLKTLHFKTLCPTLACTIPYVVVCIRRTGRIGIELWLIDFRWHSQRPLTKSGIRRSSKRRVRPEHRCREAGCGEHEDRRLSRRPRYARC